MSFSALSAKTCLAFCKWSFLLTLMHFLQVVARPTLQSHQKTVLELWNIRAVWDSGDHLLQEFVASSSEMGFRFLVSLLKLFAEFHQKHIFLGIIDIFDFIWSFKKFRPPKWYPFFLWGSLCTALQVVPYATFGGGGGVIGCNTL